MPVKHLPPVIKQLLTLRNPQLPPPPPLSKLSAVFKSTFDDAQRKNATTGWLTLTVSRCRYSPAARVVIDRSHLQTCTLLTANVPSSVGHLYKFATRANPDDVKTRHSLDDSVNKAALMRESALKSSIFVGVPRVNLRLCGIGRRIFGSQSFFQTILSLAGMTEVFEDDVKAGLRKDSKRYAPLLRGVAVARHKLCLPELPTVTPSTNSSTEAEHCGKPYTPLMMRSCTRN